MIEVKTRELYLQHQQVEQSNNFLNRILHSMSGGVIVTDANFTISLVNTAASELLLEPSENLVGQSLWNAFPLESTYLSSSETASPKVSSDQTEGILLRRVDHQPIPVSYSFSHIENEENEVEAIVCLFQDLSLMKTLERQLLQSQKLESVGQLAAGIAHEINTPIQYVRDNTVFVREEFDNVKRLLVAVEQLLEACSDQSSLQAERQTVLTIIDDIDLSYLVDEIPAALNQSFEGAESVARIVRSMKTFSHPGTEEKTHANINEAIESTVTVSKNEWKYVSDIELELDPSLPLVNCHPGELTQVFLNLIVNAAHAIGEATDNGKKGKGKITLATKRHEEHVEIQVRDTGSGIPHEVQSKIFDPFFTTKALGKGTGQGLAIVYSTITDRHNGSIEFQTEVGKGTTFLIELPTENIK